MIGECDHHFVLLAGSKGLPRSLISVARFGRQIASPGCRIEEKPQKRHGGERDETSKFIHSIMACSGGIRRDDDHRRRPRCRTVRARQRKRPLQHDAHPRGRAAARHPHRHGSTCTKNGAGWACYAVPDERTALDAEIGRLQAESREAEGADSRRGRPSPARSTRRCRNPIRSRRDPKVAEGDRKIEIPLPSDQDVDRVMSFLEKAWRRLIDMANRVQKDVSGKI